MRTSYGNSPFRLSDDEEGPHFRSLPPPLLFMPLFMSLSLFIPLSFPPRTFLQLCADPISILIASSKVRTGERRVRPRLNRPLHASNFRRVFGGGKCYRCRRFSAGFFPFNSRPYITHHPKSTPRAFFAALFLAILVPDSLDLHIKADEFLCPSFPSSHGFQISNFSLF